MNICTIATEGEWLDLHAARWLRYVRANVPGAVTHLILASDTMDEATGGYHPVVSGFDAVRYYERAKGTRPWFNEVRMRACALFGVDRMTYLDADADVLADVTSACDGVAARLGFCRSPIVNRDWARVCAAQGWDVGGWMADNCLLVMRGDFVSEYQSGVELVAGVVGVHPRTSGTIAFNAMLRMNEGLWEEMDAGLSCIWPEADKYETVNIVQYCNDHGKAKRERLEMLDCAVRGVA